MMSLEFHQFDLRYESLRSGDAKREKKLLGSLLEHGQQTPVVVVAGDRADQFILVDGYKRLRALKKTSADTVTATVWAMSEADALVFERLLRMDQEDSALEQGWFIRALIDSFAMTARQLAVRLDKSDSWVSRRLGLVKALPELAIDLVRRGKVCAHAAEKYFVPLARAKPEECIAFAQAVASGSYSARQVGELYRGYVSGSDKTRALVLENPNLFLQAQSEAAKDKKQKAPPLELVLEDLAIIASVSRRAQRRVSDPLLMLSAIKGQDNVREALLHARSSFQKLEQVLGEGVSDVGSGSAHGDLEAA